MSRLPFVRIGVIGFGPSWRESLLPAILNMTSRVRVVAVYDDLASAARQQQEPLHADVVHGIRPLLARNDVDAIVLRQVGWHADWLLDRLREQERPLWFGQDVELTERQSDAFYHSIVENGAIVFPELRLRYLPATLRLRELMATTLGPIIKMVTHADAWNLSSSGQLPLSHLLDGCMSLLQRRAVAIEPLSTSPAANAAGVRIAFDERPPSQRPPQVEIHWSDASTTDAEGTEPLASSFCELTCENGTAVIVSRDELRWTSEGRSGQEKLASERTAWEVMLDVFARRVSGGLIPTPDLGDLRRAQQLAAAVDQVRQTRAGVRLH